MKYLFTSIVGSFVFDNNFNLVEEVRFKKGKLSGKSVEEGLKKKYKDLKKVPEEKLGEVLAFLKKKDYFTQFYNQNLVLTKKKIKSSVSEDLLIIQAISNYIELDKVCNLLSRRLREWYSWYLPEFAESLEDNEKFTELIVERSKKDLMKELGIEDTMGSDLGKEDVREMILLGNEILSLHSLRKKHEDYLQKIMKTYCPNLLALAGVTIGAKLFELGRSLKHLAMLPASTIQLLGAEKALFRHIKTGSKSPKYGVIINHPLIQNAKKQERGKVARSLADKLILCIRLDYFKGEFKALEYKKDLEEIHRQ